LFQKLNEEFNFDLDVCATSENTKCELFYSPEQDSFSMPWNVKDPVTTFAWMNPPYGKEIKDWIAKADAETINNVVTVALLPSRTDIKWFHDYIYKKHEIRFIKGRLKFVGGEGPAPFPSMFVIFKEK